MGETDRINLSVGSLPIGRKLPITSIDVAAAQISVMHAGGLGVKPQFPHIEPEIPTLHLFPVHMDLADRRRPVTGPPKMVRHGPHPFPHSRKPAQSGLPFQHFMV